MHHVKVNILLLPVEHIRNHKALGGPLGLITHVPKSHISVYPMLNFLSGTAGFRRIYDDKVNLLYKAAKTLIKEWPNVLNSDKGWVQFFLQGEHRHFISNV